MNALIDQMRADFGRVMAFRLDRGEWSWADVDEIGLAIRAIVAGGDAELIKAWAAWVAELSASEYGPVPALPHRGPTACLTCRHVLPPGRPGSGDCYVRTDAPPDDLGATCPDWRAA